jgi:hypothetical protein
MRGFNECKWSEEEDRGFFWKGIEGYAIFRKMDALKISIAVMRDHFKV